MATIRKTCLALLSVLAVLCLGFAFAACGGKDGTPTYGYGEEGAYYTDTGEGECLLTLRSGIFVLTPGDGTDVTGTYEFTEGGIVMVFDGDGTTCEGTVSNNTVRVDFDGTAVTFLRRQYYTVFFEDGSETLSEQAVLNGKAAQDPGDPGKEGCVFVGWYADPDFTERYSFDTAVTGHTFVYARFVEIEGTTEYTITYDFGNGEAYTTETLNGKIYDLPEAEQAGYTFIGWWVSATNNADELTYRYDGETLYEDTTLYAVYASGSYIGASIKDGALTWESAPASEMAITVTGENGVSSSYTATATSMSYTIPELDTGKYTISFTSGGVTETLVYVANGLARVSGITVISGSILMYGAVEGAERYYVTIECGTEGHDHTMVDNGGSLYYDFSNCGMPADGITFTVYAYADGRYMSESAKFCYFRGLDRAEVTVEGNEITWERVSLAQEYEVYIDGVLVATTSDANYSLSNYGTGTYEIAVKPVTTGYYSELSETISFTKTTLASPIITGIDNYTISWTEAEGATGYIVKIGDIETTVETGTSLILTDENYTEGLDQYEISVKTMAQDSANDSPYSDAITVTGTSVGSAVSYNNGTVTWQYSLSASEYRITVNDGDELIVTGTNSSAITLTKSGNNEITIYFVDDEDNIYGTASITVYAYAIVFDARGGTAVLNGEEIDTIYVAKGDTVTLPDADRGVVEADFLGWYTLPDTTADPDAKEYMGDGVAFEDGTVFTGNATMVLYASWVNPRMRVALDAGAGTLTDEDGNEIAETVISLNGRSYEIAVPEIEDKAYAFYGWYSAPGGSGVRYTDEKGNAYAPFSDETVTTLYARWITVLSFSLTTYNGRDVLAVSKGGNIDLVDEVTVPAGYTYRGTEYEVEMISSMAFSSCPNLKTVNLPDTIIYMDIVNNGYDSGTGVFALTPLENVNVYAAGEPSTTKEVTYYSSDGVLFRLNANTEEVELFYYPYGRTAETYLIPATVSDECELTLDGLDEVPVVRDVTATGTGVFSGHAELTYMVIPEYVTSIGTSTFYGCTSLTGVEFEGDVDRIEDSMFQGCTALESFEIPYTVKEIGSSAFRNCTALTTFTVPDNVETMGTYVFYGCTGLETVYLSQNLSAVNDYDFRLCTSLTGVYMPYGIRSVGAYAFYGCTALKEIDLPESLTKIGDRAFYGCTALRSMYVPSAVASVGDYAFYNCYSLSSLTLSEGVGTIGSYAFQNCYSLTHVTVPSTVTSIGTQAFCQCYKLVEVCDLSSLGIEAGDSGNGYVGYYALNVYTGRTGRSHMVSSGDFEFIYDDDRDYHLVGYVGEETDVTLPDEISGREYSVYDYCLYERDDLTGVTIPSNVTAIGGHAFEGCTHLSSVTLSEGLTDIGEYAFRGCFSLTRVTIPSSVYAIGDRAFENCFKLVEVENLSSRISVTAGSTANGYVGYYAKNVYTGTSGESRIVRLGDFRFVHDDEGYYLIEYVGEDSDITLPTSVEGESYAVYDYAFYGCSGLRSVTMLSGVEWIGDYAFYGCSNLESVTVSPGVSSIGESAFREDERLREVVMPDGTARIGEYCFYGCTSLFSVAIPSGVTEIEDYAFYGCTALVSVSIPYGVTRVGENAFYGCASLAGAELPETVDTIGEYAFCDCYSLRYVNIPYGVTEVPFASFYEDESLESIDIPDTVTSIGNQAFQHCTALRDVTLGSGIREIGRYVFDGTAAYYDATNWTGGVLYLGSYLIIGESSVSGTLAMRDGTLAAADYCFYGNKTVLSVEMPDSLRTLGKYAFYQCTSLNSVSFNDGLERIGDRAFYGCTALTGVVLPDSLESAGSYIFYNCTALSYAVIGSGVTVIGSYMFRGCTALEAVVIRGIVNEVEANAFYNCSRLTQIFYGGDEESWNSKTVGSNNSPLTSSDLTVYYYSETQPAEEGNFWHYDSYGNVVVWG